MVQIYGSDSFGLFGLLPCAVLLNFVVLFISVVLPILVVPLISVVLSSCLLTRSLYQNQITSPGATSNEIFPPLLFITSNMNPSKMGGEALSRLDTISSVALTPEQFERLYLGPPNKVKGDLRKTFGNPTPLGIAGLLICITPLTCELMGW